MNKRIKRIIAMALVLGTFSAVSPTQFDILTTKAYASDNTDKDYGIENLEVRKTNSSDEDDDDSLTMYSNSDYKDSITFDRSQYDYYVKTAASSINLKITKVSGCTYKIFKKGNSKAYSSADDLELKSGDNVFEIRTYDTGDFDEKNIEKNQLRCYEIHVEKKGASSISLEDIKLSEGKINFSKNTYSYNVEVDSDIDKIKVTADPEDEDNTVKINDKEVTDHDFFRREISLDKGKNTITIKVYDEAESNKTYTLNIYRGTTATATKATVEYGPNDYKQPNVYLEGLKLNNGDINLDFKKNVSIYNVKVDSSVDQMYVSATPDESNYKVQINNKKLTGDNQYEATLNNLASGENTFTIKVTDTDDNSRNYTLNIYRGAEIPAKNIETNTANNSSQTEAKANQWVEVSGKWQYNGTDGKPLKNQIFYDPNYMQNYYVDTNGFMTTGWQSFNGKYYYGNNSGAIVKGWLQLGTTWYHLDTSTGAMDTGWFQDGVKWYYLNSDGSMARDTYIGGFKLGSDGAWIN